MGLFSFFNRNGKSEALNGTNSNGNAGTDIPEHVFIEKARPSEENDVLDGGAFNEHGIYRLYSFLDRNHEGKGYDDALTNPDSTHLQENIDALRNDLQRTIKRVKTFYEDFLKENEFHIITRSRSGMIDTVEELTMKKEIAERHMVKIQEIEKETIANIGDCQGILMSYSRGFRNGLAAISHHSILKKQF